MKYDLGISGVFFVAGLQEIVEYTVVGTGRSSVVK